MNKEEDSRKHEKRRARNDPQNRNYVCGCGKSYLSYPALYTHQKAKHGKVKPPGTKTPLVNGSGHRGRPKKEESTNAKREEIREEISEMESSDLSDDGLDEFLYFLTCFAKSLKLEAKNNEGNSVKQEKNFSLLLDVGEDDYVISEAFSKDFPGLSGGFPPILDQIKACEREPSLIESRNLEEENEPKNVSIDRIFAIFLLKIGKHLKPQYLQEIGLFLAIYRKALSEIAKKGENAQFEHLSPDFIIENSNEFILEYFNSICEEYKLGDMLLIGSGPNKLKNAITLTQHFGNWLYSCHYTDSKLEINYNDLEGHK